MHKRCALLFSPVLLLLAGTPTDAQDFGPQGVFDMGLLTVSLGMEPLIQSERERARKEGDQSIRMPRIDVSRLSAEASNEVGAASFLYKPSQQRRRANLAQFVAKTRAVDPAGADRMAATFAARDIIAMVDGIMRKSGLRADNVADAYAVYWINAWLGARGRNEDLPPAQMQAISRQAAAALSEVEELGSATDATKQELVEAMLIQAVMISGAVDMGKEQPDLMPQVRRSIAQGAGAMGLNLSAMTLTADGFRPRKGSDAGETIEAVADAEPVALAATVPSANSGVPATASNDNTATYALIVAAGGAGLVAMFMAGRASGRRG